MELLKGVIADAIRFFTPHLYEPLPNPEVEPACGKTINRNLFIQRNQPGIACGKPMATAEGFKRQELDGIAQDIANYYKYNLRRNSCEFLFLSCNLIRVF